MSDDDLKRKSISADSNGFLIQVLAKHQLGQLLAWRAKDAFTHAAILSEWEESIEGQRTIYIAICDQQVVGTVSLVYNHEDQQLADGKSRVYINALDVHPKHRRRGMAAALMEYIENEARSGGFRVITLMVATKNDPALCLYSKLGYARFKDNTWLWKGHTHNMYCLSKTLL